MIKMGEESCMKFFSGSKLVPLKKGLVLWRRREGHAHSIILSIAAASGTWILDDWR